MRITLAEFVDYPRVECYGDIPPSPSTVYVVRDVSNNSLVVCDTMEQALSIKGQTSSMILKYIWRKTAHRQTKLNMAIAIAKKYERVRLIRRLIPKNDLM